MSDEGRKTILVVDDSRVSCMMIKRFIEEARPAWRVICALNAADVKEMVEQDKPDYITLDVNMPGISGLEVAQELVGSNPEIKIALVTANSQQSVKQSASDLRIGFAKKPITSDTVKSVIQFFEGAKEVENA
jgi:two-component system, chemotaxis family, chemotaxis protein CheY